jgi:predicted ester cyclase
MDSHRMVELAQTLGAAKSRQDVSSAMKVLHRDMVLETPAFGTTARGTEENEAALTRFFKHFPDYEVSLEGHASDGDVLMCWGRVRMTLTGNWLGVVPNGKQVELPVFLLFSFQDDLIVGERFFFDLSELCAQSGVSTDTVRHRLFGRGQ